MKRSLVGFLSVLCLSTLMLTGCGGGGGGETSVVEAPPTVDASAPEGISEEDYAKEMAKQMQAQ